MNGILPFTKIGQINYYDYDDIKRILNNNIQYDVDGLVTLKRDKLTKK